MIRKKFTYIFTMHLLFSVVVWADLDCFTTQESHSREFLINAESRPIYYDYRSILLGFSHTRTIFVVSADSVALADTDLAVLTENGRDSLVVCPENISENKISEVIQLLYYGSGEPDIEKMCVSGDTLKLDIHISPWRDTSWIEQNVWVWHDGLFQLVSKSVKPSHLRKKQLPDLFNQCIEVLIEHGYRVTDSNQVCPSSFESQCEHDHFSMLEKYCTEFKNPHSFRAASIASIIWGFSGLIRLPKRLMIFPSRETRNLLKFQLILPE